MAALRRMNEWWQKMDIKVSRLRIVLSSVEGGSRSKEGCEYVLEEILIDEMVCSDSAFDQTMILLMGTWMDSRSEGLTT